MPPVSARAVWTAPRTGAGAEEAALRQLTLPASIASALATASVGRKGVMNPGSGERLVVRPAGAGRATKENASSGWTVETGSWRARATDPRPRLTRGPAF